MTDPDLWGHIRFGQLMLSSGKIVSRDPFSYTAFGHIWRDHEYLTEIIMAAVYNGAGVIGLKIWKVLCISATILFLVVGMAETEANCLVQINILAVAVAVIAPHVQFRPQLHSYLLFAILLAILARDNYQGSAPLWIAVPVIALWSNLHGGFIIGVITLVIYTGVRALSDFFSSRDLWRTIRIVVIAGAAIGSTLLPPRGLSTWHAVLLTVCSPATYKTFADWQPLSTAIYVQWHYNEFGTVVYLLLLLLWAVLTASVALRPYGNDFPLLLIAFAMSMAALKCVRNVPFAALACVIPAVRHLGLLLDGGNLSSSMKTLLRQSGWFIAGAALLLTRREIFSTRLPSHEIYPRAAVNFMLQEHLHGNILNDFGWGEYLIWHLPNSKVFIDSRYDMVYPPSVIEDYLTFRFQPLRMAQVLRAYPHDFILIPAGSEANKSLIRVPGWRLI
ncbi:MAG TPA: hypothetical protein VJ728_08835, partial [Candidatus Binataceae bacterium]|nr:hypothetical protein [Candidatus Binataceae bacterium]